MAYRKFTTHRYQTYLLAGTINTVSGKMEVECFNCTTAGHKYYHLPEQAGISITNTQGDYL